MWDLELDHVFFSTVIYELCDFNFSSWSQCELNRVEHQVQCLTKSMSQY